MYRPLPDSVTILPSSINKLGLIATKDISAQTDLGMCHLELGKVIIRTPLGGFINHSDKPNCAKDKYMIRPGFDRWNIMVIEDIEEGEELTLKYKLYVPKT